jgi:glyoxylase-like metal-dependent hydrolase (beta-lactamase superfamily II)
MGEEEVVVSGTPPLPHPFFRPEHHRSAARILPQKLRALFESGEPPVLLDVRAARERRWSHLAGDVHIPLSALPDRLDELPRARTIVAYDHYGSQAPRAAEFLETRGFPHVASLEGGIDDYALQADLTVPRYRAEDDESGVYLHQLPRLETGCLSYLVGDLSSRDAILIDPGADIDPYLALLKEGHWRLGAIVETHTHADHLAGHSALHAKTDAPIYVSRRSPALYPHRLLTEGESIPFGAEELGVLETPGHTRDHLTLRLRETVFTGDTLLIGSCGRADLGDGSPELLFESLSDKLLRLPHETEVYPAHFGPHHALVDQWVSSIGFERATNEALRQESREAFLRYMTEGWPPKPRDFEEIVRANLAR